MVWFFCLVCVLVSAMSLGSMRLYGLYLEHRLAYVTTKIDEKGNENAGLEERYSSLLSPSRIYSYAKSQLNMVSAHEIEVIKLGMVHGGEIAQGQAPQGIKPSRMGAAFVQAAHAKD